MKIAVVGTGAMGSVYAALLAGAGNEVWAIDRWQDHVDAINANGLRVEGASGDRTVPLRASVNAADAGVCDLVIVATKALDVEAAAESIRPLLGSDTVVLPIQNGLGAPDRIASVVGEEPVMIGVTGGFGASMRGPGHAHHNGWELVRLGERRGPATDRVRTVAQVWEDAGFRVAVYDDVDQLVWEKLLCNSTFSGTCALLEWPIGEVLADPHAWSIASGCASEVYAVARAKGIHLDFDDPVAYARAFGETIPGARPSMLLDVLAGRPCEVDVINGAIGPAARTVGLEAPINDTVAALVRAKNLRAS
ncbi:MAG: ketopantoate reductase family protein [Gaiellales bacterium]